MERVRVPVRKENDGAPAASRKPARVDEIVFSIGGCDWRGEPQEVSVRASNFFFETRIGNFAGTEDLYLAPFQSEISWRAVRKEIVARLDDPIVKA